MNPFAPAIFADGAPCIPCCGGEVGCPCYFPIPIGVPNINPPYSSYADAATAIAARAFDCLVYGNTDGYTVSTTPGINSLAISASQAIAGDNGIVLWMAAALKAGSTIQFDWSGSASGAIQELDSAVLVQILKCDWSTLSSQSDTDSDPAAFSGTLTGPVDKFGPTTIPEDNTYIIYLSYNSGYGTTSTSVAVDWTVTVDDTAAFQPIVSLWDDGGTTRLLEACPKFYLPPLTESSGDWYADATSAADAITDLTSNCVGYIESLANVASFTAIDGGTVLTLTEALTTGAMTGPAMWGSANAVDGQTITVTAAVGAGTATITVFIYDDSGTLVQASGAVASPWVSSALPYHGRYIIRVLVGSSSSTTSLSAAITSSGALSVNLVQALYDVGLTCPARINCT